MPVTYEQLIAKANSLAKNLQVDEIEGMNFWIDNLCPHLD